MKKQKIQKKKWMNSLVEIQEQNFQKEEHDANTKKENILKNEKKHIIIM